MLFLQQLAFVHWPGRLCLQNIRTNRKQQCWQDMVCKYLETGSWCSEEFARFRASIVYAYEKKSHKLHMWVITWFTGETDVWSLDASHFTFSAWVFIRPKGQIRYYAYKMSCDFSGLSADRYMSQLSECFLIARLTPFTFMTHMWRREFALLVPHACCQLVGFSNGEQAHWAVTSRRPRIQIQNPGALWNNV